MTVPVCRKVCTTIHNTRIYLNASGKIIIYSCTTINNLNLNYKYLITSIRSTCLTKWQQSQCTMGNMSYGKPSILAKKNPDIRHFLCANMYIVWLATVHVVYVEYLMYRGAVVVLIVTWLDLQLPIQLVCVLETTLCEQVCQ